MDNKATLLVFVVLLVVMFYFWYQADSPEKRAAFFSPPQIETITVSKSSNSDDKKDQESIHEEEEIIDASISPWEGLFTIKRGNAGRTIQPREEYIILQYSRRATESVNISGWQLENNPLRGGKRVTIPQGVDTLFAAKNLRLRRDIVLEPGDQAIVLTGRMPSLRPVDIDVSFKVNICLGYLSNLNSYSFQPSIRSRCPGALEAPGATEMDDDCYAFIRRLSTCRIPEIITHGEDRGQVDGVSGLSRECREFISNNYNYQSCVRNYISRDDFHQPEWRIFLNQTWALWADNREVITLYDSEGRKVNQLSY